MFLRSAFNNFIQESQLNNIKAKIDYTYLDGQKDTRWRYIFSKIEEFCGSPFIFASFYTCKT